MTAGRKEINKCIKIIFVKQKVEGYGVEFERAMVTSRHLGHKKVERFGGAYAVCVGVFEGVSGDV